MPTLRALCALRDQEPSKAIELLQTAAPYELAIPGTWFAFVGNLYPVYIRGKADLAAHQADQASAEFQKILYHRGIVASDSVGAIARFEMGQALATAGDKTGAKHAYQDFLTLWKDADPEIPIFRYAKAEYAKLQK